MKRVLACILAGTMIMSASGCKNKENNKTADVSALSLMEQVNGKNILHPDPVSRLWYTIDPLTFSDSESDGIGDLQGIINQIQNLSDGDEATKQKDLNVNGIYIQNLLKKDGNNRIIDFMSINPAIGTDEVLKKLTEQASQDQMAIMIGLDLAAVSKENEDFQRLIQAANALQPDQSIPDLPQDAAGLFNLNEEKLSDSWLPLGSSKLFYQAYEGTDAPTLNEDNENMRQLVLKVIDHYIGLGVSGFYLHNVNDFYQGEPQKNVDFVNWLYDEIKDRKSDATVVASADPYEEPMQQLKASLAIPGYSGAEGYIVKAVTGTMNAKELGEALKHQEQKASNQAVFLNSDSYTLDLLKTENRLPQLKMALALHLLMSGQVFISAGDEIGLQKDAVDFVTDGFYKPISKNGKTEDKSGNAVNLVFGSMEEQNKNGDSILNFVRQAIRLRDSFIAVSSGTMNILDGLTTEDVLAVQKDAGDSNVVLVFNLSDQEQKVNLDGVEIKGLPCELGGLLLTDAGEMKLENNELYMPPYSAAVLK